MFEKNAFTAVSTCDYNLTVEERIQFAYSKSAQYNDGEDGRVEHDDFIEVK